MKLIGLTGPAGSGKDTVARFLCDTQGFVQIAFADPLRAGVKAMFGLTDLDLNDRFTKEAVIPHLGVSPRELMQGLGMWGREAVDNDVWAILAEGRIQRLKQSKPCLHIKGIVVSDVRFENEADLVREHGGVLWHIHRTTLAYTGLASNTRLHISEQGIAWLPTDKIIHNSGSLDDLYETIANLFPNEE